MGANHRLNNNKFIIIKFINNNKFIIIKSMGLTQYHIIAKRVIFHIMIATAASNQVNKQLQIQVLSFSTRFCRK